MSHAGRYIAGTGAAPLDSIKGNDCLAVGPDGAGNVDLLGAGAVTVSGDAATHTLTIGLVGVATLYDTDNGDATPVLGILNIKGGSNIATSALVNPPNTVTINVSGTTAHALQIGNVGQSLTSLGVATNGQIPIGSSANDPVLNTITAGTGITVTNGAGTISIATNGAVVGETITGNTGGPLSPTAGNWNIVTANSTVVFAGAVSTETLDFNITNLVLGSSLPALAGGTGNTGVGQASLASLTSASFSSMLGTSAGSSITTSSYNCAMGWDSLDHLTTGSGQNVSIGAESGRDLVTGAFNTFIGRSAGLNYTGSESSNICIGYSVRGTGAESNTLHIGNGTSAVAGGLTQAFICGIDGVNVGSVAKVLTMASDQLGTATITAGSGITVTPGANTITISSIGAGLTWSVITANQTAAVENGYFCNKAGTLALALPAASAIGDIIEVTNENTALGVQFTQAAGQQILIGNTNTTLGATGTLTSSAVGDTLKIVCKTANTIWRVLDMVGNWSPV